MFATDSLAAASAFIEAQAQVVKPTPHFYEVELDDAHRAPFRLVHEIANRMKGGRTLTAVLGEYWSPAQDWVFWEYFGPSLTVIREVVAPPPEDVVRFKLRFDADLDRARQL